MRTGDLFSIWNYDGNIAFEDIITTTEDFDIKYCIGTGGYGSVYKANLPTGKVVALKNFIVQRPMSHLLTRVSEMKPKFCLKFVTVIL